MSTRQVPIIDRNNLKIASTSDVLYRHLRSFAEYDLDGVLADYASDAVLFVPAGPLFRSLRGPAPRLRCSGNTSRVITPTFSGLPKQQTIRTNSLRIPLSCETGK